MRRRIVVIALAGVAFSSSVVAQPKQERETLPEAARDLIRPWMQSHKTDVDQLLAAVLTLNYKRSQEVATNLVNDPHLAKPSEATWDSVNNAVPRKFYELQDSYRNAARKVAASAKAQDAKALASDFGGLMQSCVTCHAAYMQPR